MCIVSEEQHPGKGAPPLWQAWWTAAGHRRDAPSPLTWLPDFFAAVCAVSALGNESVQFFLP